MRVRASMRKWRWHLGQTLKFWSRSFFQMTWRQPSHFTHKPSVRTFFSPLASISELSRLNQVITAVASDEWPVASKNCISGWLRWLLVLNPALRHDALLIGVLHLLHLSDGIGD